ncbi:hypothetical protein BH18ACT15_BH18ACT15_04460 [soil metagenome]
MHDRAETLACPNTRRYAGEMNPTTGVLGEAWELYKGHWKHLLTISFAVYAAVAVISLILSPLGWVGALIATVISIVGLFWVQGALVEAVQDIRDGRADLTVGATFARVRPHLVGIAIASILAGIAVGVGLLLLIVPGLILMTLWVLIVPVIVLENVPWSDSFGRSQSLVRGHAWSVFGVIVLTILLLIAFGIILGLILAALPAGAQSFVSNLVSGALTAPFIALTWTLLYHRLLAAQSG